MSFCVAQKLALRLLGRVGNHIGKLLGRETEGSSLASAKQNSPCSEAAFLPCGETPNAAHRVEVNAVHPVRRSLPDRKTRNPKPCSQEELLTPPTPLRIIRSMIARLISSRLITAFQQFPAVMLTGARQTGKTTLVRSLWPHASYVLLDQTEKRLRPSKIRRRFCAAWLPRRSSTRRSMPRGSARLGYPGDHRRGAVCPGAFQGPERSRRATKPQNFDHLASSRRRTL